MADLFKQRIETTFQDHSNPKGWSIKFIPRDTLSTGVENPDEIKGLDKIEGVEFFDPLPIEDRDFAITQLAPDRTVENPAVVRRENVLELARSLWIIEVYL